MANNSDVIQAKVVIDELTQAFITHGAGIEKAAINLNEYSQKIIALPSQVKAMVTAISENNLALNQSNQAIDNSTKKLAENKAGIDKIVEAKQKNVARTREEMIEQRLANRETDNAIMQNIKLAGAYENLSAKAKAAGNELRNIIVAGRQANQTQEQYNAQLKRAQDVFTGYNTKLLEADKAIGAWGRSNLRTIEGLNQLQTGLTSAMHAFGIFTGMYAAAQVVLGSIRINEHLSDDLAQLQIYLKGTKEDADAVFESIKKLDTRTSLADLLGYSQIIAKKGVAQEEIAGIVKEFDNLFMVLGDEAGDKKEGIASIVKLITIFNEDGKITEERVRGIGSALQYLTTHGVATGDYLINFSERLGAFRSLTGQNIAQITGMGAAYEQLGQRVEVASNATGQIITKLMSNAAKYAQMANIPLKEFKDLLETNSSEALIRFAEGMKNNTGTLEEFAQSFEDVGLRGARVKGVLAEISINGDLFRDKMKSSAEAMDKFGANAEAAALKQETFAATIAKIKKEFEILVSDQSVQDFFSYIAVAIFKVVQGIMAIPFGVVIGGLSAWVSWQALLKGQIIATAVAQAWNNEQTSLGITRMALARLGLLGQAEAQLANKIATTGSTYAIEANIAIKQAEIAVNEERIAVLVADTLATGENAAANEVNIASHAERIAMLEAEIVAEEAAIVANEALTTSMAATPWGAIAIAIGLVTLAVYELATAEDDEAERKRRREEEHEQNVKYNKMYHDLEIKDLQEKNDKIRAENRQMVIDGKKTQAEANKDITEGINANVQGTIDANKKMLQLDEADFKRIKAKNDRIIKEQNKLNDAAIAKGSPYGSSDADEKIHAAKMANALAEQDIEDKRSSSQQFIDDLQKKMHAGQMDRQEAEIELTKEQQKAEEARLKRLNEYEKLIYERDISNLERRKERVKDKIDSEKYGVEEIKNLNVLQSVYEVSIAERTYVEKKRLAKIQRAEELNQLGLSAQERLNIQASYLNRLKIAENEYLTSKENAISESIERIKAINEKYEKEQEGFRKRLADANATQTRNFYKNQISDEKTLFEDKKKYALELFNFNVDKLNKEFSLALLIAKARGASPAELKAMQAEYDVAYQAIYESYSNTMESITAKNEKELAKQKAEIDNYLKSFLTKFGSNSPLPTLFKILNKEIAGFGKNWKVTFVAMAEVAKEAFALIGKRSQAHFAAEYKRAEKQHDTAIAFAGNSAAAKDEIDKQYEDKRREIANREAKAQKELLMFNVAISTAQAAVAAYASQLIPGDPTSIVRAQVAAAITIGFGLGELALIASQEVPQYWTGVQNSNAGLALVDEKQPEVHTDKFGNVKSMGSEKGANLRMLEKGDNIYKSREAYFEKEFGDILSKNGISPFNDELEGKATNMIMVNGDNGLTKEDMKQILLEMAKQQEAKPTDVTVLDEGGFTRFIDYGHTRKRKLDNTVRSKGQIFKFGG